MRDTKKTVRADQLVVGDGPLRVNGRAAYVTALTFGPVWLNEARTHMMCGPGDLLVTLDDGFRIAARPDTKFTRA